MRWMAPVPVMRNVLSPVISWVPPLDVTMLMVRGCARVLVCLILLVFFCVMFFFFLVKPGRLSWVVLFWNGTPRISTDTVNVGSLGFIPRQVDLCELFSQVSFTGPVVCELCVCHVFVVTLKHTFIRQGRRPWYPVRSCSDRFRRGVPHRVSTGCLGQTPGRSDTPSPHPGRTHRCAFDRDRPPPRPDGRRRPPPAQPSASR